MGSEMVYQGCVNASFAVFFHNNLWKGHLHGGILVSVYC